ncbi:hypothetical protein TNCV_3555001 [Trichonephila clavipes]|nr:hypothetical protein TNCV_3555001 [Trichonephila clavipes]
MWSMVAQRLTQITPPAATPVQLWQREEAAWSAVPQEHIQSLFESMPRHNLKGGCTFSGKHEEQSGLINLNIIENKDTYLDPSVLLSPLLGYSLDIFQLDYTIRPPVVILFTLLYPFSTIIAPYSTTNT